MEYTIFNSSVMDLQKERNLNTMSVRYISYNEAKAKIASLNLKTRKEYIDYILSNNINYLPTYAECIYHKKGWTGFADFLGLTEAQYKANKQNQWADVVKTRKPYTKSNKTAKATQVIAPKTVKLIGLDPDKVIQFLITEDVAPETIVKMVAELDIKSSTLMNDLCKYMQDRSKRQAEVWRPIGYTTAEAQMTTKI